MPKHESLDLIIPVRVSWGESDLMLSASKRNSEGGALWQLLLKGGWVFPHSIPWELLLGDGCRKQGLYLPAGTYLQGGV